MGLLGSPGAFKWEGLNGGTFSPLTSDKSVSQKREYEAGLVGAFRREKDKDLALQALTAENQAVMQLASVLTVSTFSTTFPPQYVIFLKHACSMLSYQCIY